MGITQVSLLRPPSPSLPAPDCVCLVLCLLRLTWNVTPCSNGQLQHSTLTSLSVALTTDSFPSRPCRSPAFSTMLGICLCGTTVSITQHRGWPSTYFLGRLRWTEHTLMATSISERRFQPCRCMTRRLSLLERPSSSIHRDQTTSW
jgi:hypothetical protein